MKLAVAATLAAALLAPSVAQGATLTVDPAQRCYRETQTIQLPGAGFTANAQVDFTRDGVAVPANPPIVADAVGNIAPLLTLPGLLSGQRNLTYTATDSANTANIATLGLLVTATDVDIKPLQGRPNRRLTITGRGFFGGGSGSGRTSSAAGARRATSGSEGSRAPARSRVRASACSRPAPRPASTTSSSTPSGASAATAWPSRPSASRSPGPRARRPPPRPGASSTEAQPAQATRSANGPAPARRRTVSVTRSAGRRRHHSTP